MALINETFDHPVNLKGETLRGLTTFAFSSGAGDHNLLEGCTFDGAGGQYGIRIEPPHKPRVEFRGGKVLNARKLAKVIFCYFNGVELYQAEDGIFSSAYKNPRDGFVLVEGCTIHKLGLTKQDHADAFQAEAGQWYVLRRNTILAEWNATIGVMPNSVAFFEAKYAPIRNVILANNEELRGGGHMLQFHGDAHSIDGVRVTDNRKGGGYVYSPLRVTGKVSHFYHRNNFWEKSTG